MSGSSSNATGRALSDMQTSVTERVGTMYSQHIFPKRNAAGVQTVQEGVVRILGELGLRLQDLQGKRLLDAGCGTGELACFFASCGAEVSAIDISKSSLAYARTRAKELALENIQFIEGSLLDYPFPKEAFDIVFSHMVLHHTADPKGAFSNIVKALKPGGSVIFKVFCLWGRMGLFQKAPLWHLWVVRLLGGSDPDRKVAIGERLFYRPGHETPHGVEKSTYLYDLFGVPKVANHTWGELLGWLKQNRIAYAASSPAMEFSKLVEPLLKKRESATLRGKILRVAGQTLLRVAPLHRLPACRRPSWISRGLGQAVTFFSGSNMTAVRGIKQREGIR